MADAFRYFGLSCPNGGSFYICENNATEFIGCCTTDPCTPQSNGHCPMPNLRTSSFSADTYINLPRQDCDDTESINIWYTCKFDKASSNEPPFMGCCASNPCQKRLCGPGDLRPAKLSREPHLKASFLQPGIIATSTDIPPSVTASTDAGEVSMGLSPGAIGGIVVGVVLLVILAVVFFLYKRGWKVKVNKEAVTHTDTPTPMGIGIHQDTIFAGQPLPGLTSKGGYRESYLSGQTYYQGHDSPQPHMQYPPGDDAEYFQAQRPSATPYSQYGHLSQGSYDGYAPNAPVELPLSLPVVQELPAGQGAARLSPQMAHNQRSSMPLVSSAVSPSLTPISSPRMPEEGTVGYQPSHGRSNTEAPEEVSAARVNQTQASGDLPLRNNY